MLADMYELGNDESLLDAHFTNKAQNPCPLSFTGLESYRLDVSVARGRQECVLIPWWLEYGLMSVPGTVKGSFVNLQTTLRSDTSYFYAKTRILTLSANMWQFLYACPSASVTVEGWQRLHSSLYILI